MAGPFGCIGSGFVVDFIDCGADYADMIYRPNYPLPPSAVLAVAVHVASWRWLSYIFR
jgi:hypothetical protein